MFATLVMNYISLLHEFNSINLLFQKDVVDHVTLIDNWENLFLQMLQRIVLADHVSITIDLTLLQFIYS